MAIKNLEKMDIYNPTNYVNNSEPDIDADNLNKTENKLEETVAKANEIIDALKTLISTVQTNSDNTVPSSSLAYAMQQEITKNKEDIATANSNLEKLDSNLELLYSSDSLAIATQDIMLPHDFSTYKIIIIYLAINYNGSILHFSDFVIRLPTDTKITSNFTLSSYFNNTGFLSIRCSLFNNLLQIKEISAGTSWSGQKMALYVYGK
jgi:hypothetical protein